MKYDAFSRCHPAVNFLFFAGAIGCSIVIMHPAYLAASLVGSIAYYLLLHGASGWKLLAGSIPVFLLITILNPLVNTSGQTRLFSLFGRPYTLEALCYGAVMGTMFLLMMLWFGCYNQVLTGDKFTSLFGNMIPSLSLLLVMVLRMIPSLTRKAAQIIGARASIGKGVSANDKPGAKIRAGMMILSALTDHALEGSIITADSMRARGYGAGKRTSFRIYRMTAGDYVLISVEAVLLLLVIALGHTGASFTPVISIDYVSWGFAAYCLFLLIPTGLHIKEAIQWHSSISKI